MYFLVKNIRSCSKQLGRSSDLELFQKTKLNLNDIARFISLFAVHPEKLKQALKERDAHMLCKFFDSEDYKKRVTEFLEMQSKILSKNTIIGLRPANIEYQHVLSCAQPSYQAAKTIIHDKLSQEQDKDDKPRRRRIKKGTIIQQILMTKSRNEEYRPQNNRTVTVKTTPTKKITHRTTIMPIFLKKLRNKPRVLAGHFGEDSYNISEVENEVLPDPAKKIEQQYETRLEPLYAQILQRSDIYKNKYKSKIGSNQTIRSISEKVVDIPKLSSLKPYSGESRKQLNDVYKSPKIATAGPSTRSISHKPPSIKTCHKKNMNLKSYSELLLVEPVKCRSSKTKTITNEIDGGRGNIKITVLKQKQPDRQVNTLLQMVQETEKKKQLSLDDDHVKSDVRNKKEVKKKCREHELQLMSLYKKLKIGKPKENVQDRSSLKEKIVIKNPTKCMDNSQKHTKASTKQSFTYKLVSKHRQKINQFLKEKFRINTPFWDKAILDAPVKETFLNVKEGNNNSSVVEKNITECLHKPIPHFVQCVKRSNVQKHQCSDIY